MNRLRLFRLPDRAIRSRRYAGSLSAAANLLPIGALASVPLGPWAPYRPFCSTSFRSLSPLIFILARLPSWSGHSMPITGHSAAI